MDLRGNAKRQDNLKNIGGNGMDVTRALNSVGKKIFTEFYYDFKNCRTAQQKNELAQKLLYENPNANSLNAQKTLRINYARRIFDNNKQLDALNLVIQATRVDNDIVNKAKQIRFAESQ